MSAPTFEQIMIANLALVTGAYAWKNELTKARRLKLWNEVPAEQRPAIYQFEGGNVPYVWGKDVAKREIEIKLFAYIDAHDPSVTGASQINAIWQALNDAYDPSVKGVGSDIITGRTTLGGLVQHARIEGPVFKDPGDLDGDGILIVPVKILLP